MYLDKLTSQEVILLGFPALLHTCFLQQENKDHAPLPTSSFLTGYQFRTINRNTHALHFQRGEIH